MSSIARRAALEVRPVMALGLTLFMADQPANAAWQSARTEGGMAAFNNQGKPAVPAVILVCQRGTVLLYVNLAMDPQPDSRTIGFKAQMSAQSNEEQFVRDAATGGWVTQPSVATLGLFRDEEFTLSVTLNGMSIAGLATQGYSDIGQDPARGVDAALRPVFAACPNWRQQSSGIPAATKAEAAKERKPEPKKRRAKKGSTVAAQPPRSAAAPIPQPPSQSANNPVRIPLAAGYYAYVEGTFSTCSNPVLPPWYFDGDRFWEESDFTDPSHEFTPEALAWEMVAADRFQITYRSRNEDGQWDGFRSVNQYVITGPQSFTYVGTLGGPMNANERHQLCMPSQLPPKARWFKGR